MTTNRTSNSSLEIEWRRDVIERVFKHFDEDTDGKLSTEELIKCLSSCYGIHVDDDEIKRFLFIEEDSRIKISRILQAFDPDEDNIFKSLRNMDSFHLSIPVLGLIFKEMQANWKKSEEDHSVIDIKQLNVLLPTNPDECTTSLSNLRDMFLGLTGQAAVSFVAYRPPHVLVAANALAFLLLLLSFWLRSKKLVTAERIMVSIGISFAVLVLFLMMGMLSIPVKVV